MTFSMTSAAIPAAEAASVHTTKQGDTFYLLSKKYSVPLNSLMNANPGIQALNIYPGLKVNIPGGNTASSFIPSLHVFPEQNVVKAWGKTFQYSKTMSVKATAYSSAASENGGWGAVDYFGNPLKLGTIAVDPKVIPLGTKVLVTGHRHPSLPKKAFVAVARDIGGAIKENRVDIFIPGSPKSVSAFGYQNVKLYMIK
ncbi:LysM peptidoglycan-binding domain-containing protein [Paenibacillus lemnae]|uniref:LysM peptidoglycan-binding domain-containing protein n=2 Tax=Paenibacillus lemnae TaxID=1330551 RepID=A0A848M4D2_PAELE|nr:3D domain-containing protein [Paenibacillus lemnae]NMO95918.1 LysM peptidoglycan-binding domain-containing protein [Paenibacillus lemnae]